MTDLHKVTLRNFFIFNDNYGENEDEEEEKLLYFYPKETPIDKKLKELGLSLAIIKFVDNFSTDCCEALKTLKTRKLFFNFENNFWMIMTLNIPFGHKSDVLEGMEYLGHEVKSSIYIALLKQAYSMARLFLGPFERLIDNGSLEVLRKKLDKFFNKYLLNLRLHDCNIIDVFQGVQFMGLDTPTFLYTNCFINHIEASFPVVEHSLFLYDDKIIWSGLNPDDAQVVYRYLVNSLLPTKNSGRQDSSRKSRFVTSHHTGSDIVHSDDTLKIYLCSSKNPGQYHLVAYRVEQATLCLFIKSKEVLNAEFYRTLNTYLAEKMENVNREILNYENSNRKMVNGELTVPDSRYIYFNSMNLAIKSTLGKSSQSNVTTESLRLLVDLHEQFIALQQQGCKSSEIYIKTMTEHWVVGNMSNNRHFYVIIDRKKANLTQITGEMEKLCEKHLKSIFFHI